MVKPGAGQMNSEPRQQQIIDTRGANFKEKERFFVPAGKLLFYLSLKREENRRKKEKE
jgi:hypothetical protein